MAFAHGNIIIMGGIIIFDNAVSCCAKAAAF